MSVLTVFNSPGRYVSAVWVVMMILQTSLVAGTQVYQAEDVPVQDIVLHDLEISASTMRDALQQLCVDRRILIGFESVALRLEEAEAESLEQDRFLISIKEASVEEILQWLVDQDSRYTYSIYRDMVINVYPVGAGENPSHLPNLRVGRFEFRRHEWPANFFVNVEHRVNELGDYLRGRKLEFDRRRGRPVLPTGAGGSILSGDVVPPEIKLNLEGVTVRTILNEVSIESRRQWEEGLLYWTKSWKYEFIVDDEAETGLGGYECFGPLYQDCRDRPRRHSKATR